MRMRVRRGNSILLSSIELLSRPKLVARVLTGLGVGSRSSKVNFSPERTSGHIHGNNARVATHRTV